MKAKNKENQVKIKKVITILATVIIIFVIVFAGWVVISEWKKSFWGDYLPPKPTISVDVVKDGNNWSVRVVGISGVFEGFDNYTFVIKRGNLTLVSFTVANKQPTDPTNIDPLTGNVTKYDIYILSKEGYVIYMYDVKYLDEHNELLGGFSAGDIIYIVSDGLRSGDVFEILWSDGELCGSIELP